MGTKIKELNTYFFNGSVGEQPPEGAERTVWKEIDEEDDIINSNESFDRWCAHTKPGEVLTAGEAKQVPALTNGAIRMELMSSASGAAETSQCPEGWHEVRVIVDGERTITTNGKNFTLKQSNLLVLPAGQSYEVSGDAPATQLVVYGAKPFQLSKTYPDQEIEGDLFLEPSAVVDKIPEGPAGGAHFELVESQDINIETTFRSTDQGIYHRGFGQDEVHFQLKGSRATRTTQGEFPLAPGDFLLVPPGVSHRNVGDESTIRIVLYTRDPLNVSAEVASHTDRPEAAKTLA